MNSCRFHDRDIGPCIKVEHSPESPHICTRRRLVPLEQMEVLDELPTQSAYFTSKGFYVTSMFDGVLTRGVTHEPWCHRPCDCKGPLRRLTPEQRRDLRAWIFASNEYQRLAALIFDVAVRTGLLDRWAQRQEQLWDRLERQGVDALEFVDDAEDHGTDEHGMECSWARWVVRTT